MKFRNDEEAVSPVIGVILMVAITVILAAVIAAFMFGMGTPKQAPQAQLTFSASNSNGMTITHSGGDSIVLPNEKITIVWSNNNTAVALGTVIYSSISMDTFVSNGGTISANVSLTPGNSYTNTTLRLPTNSLVTIRILDTPTGQIIANTQVTYQ